MKNTIKRELGVGVVALVGFGILCGVARAAEPAAAPPAPSCIARDEAGLYRTAESNYAVVLGSILGNCLGTDRDDPKNELIAQLGKVSKLKGSLTERVRDSKALIGNMALYSEAEVRKGEDPTLWSAINAAMQQELKHIEALPSGDQAAVDAWADAFFNPRLWDVSRAGHSGLTGDRDLRQLPPDPTCVAARSINDCKAYVERKDSLRFMLMAGAVAGQVARVYAIGVQKDMKESDDRWLAYHDHALFQWPWELAYNGARMKRSSDCEKRTLDHMELGFCRVPDQQLILFHPDVAFQWVNGAKSTSDLSAAAIIEVAGHYRWSWGAGGQIQKPLGWSLIMSYSKPGGESAVGYGIMVHGKRGDSVALTVTKGRVGVLFSLAVADRFFTASQAARDVLAKDLAIAEKSVAGASGGGN